MAGVSALQAADVVVGCYRALVLRAFPLFSLLVLLELFVLFPRGSFVLVVCRAFTTWVTAVLLTDVGTSAL